MKLYEKVLDIVSKEFCDNWNGFCEECGVKCETEDECKANCYNYNLCSMIERLQREAMDVDSKFNDYD